MLLAMFSILNVFDWEIVCSIFMGLALAALPIVVFNKMLVYKDNISSKLYIMRIYRAFGFKLVLTIVLFIATVTLLSVNVTVFCTSGLICM